VQLGVGAYLKCHLERGLLGRIRPVLVKAHKILGAFIPVIGYVQIVLGVIAVLGFCYAVGAPWLLRRNKSQEWYDSWVITLWGIVNTFTEHREFRWGSAWNHGDYQHTSMGIIWWMAGMVGIVLSRNGKRSVIPSVIIILTAVAFQGHAQHVANSGAIHSYFGYLLMAGGLSRIIEICFVWKEGDFSVSPWQYLPPLNLILAGVLFMGSTEEQLGYLAVIDVDISSYSNAILSLGFVMFFAAVLLITLWENLTGYVPSLDNTYTEVRNPVTEESLMQGSDSTFLEDDDDDYDNDAVPLKTTVNGRF
ncbi:hypothetical protein F4703DRAFT_1732253, partial [Phycomyces blakesleeanus]